MIDTDKYEGHTEGEWCRESNDLWFHRDGKDIQIADILIRGDGDERYHEDMANARLIADAPLLLEELKRLRESHPEFLKEQWADGYISAEELYEKLMTIRRFIDGTIEHALSWEEGHMG